MHTNFSKYLAKFYRKIRFILFKIFENSKIFIKNFQKIEKICGKIVICQEIFGTTLKPSPAPGNLPPSITSCCSYYVEYLQIFAGEKIVENFEKMNHFLIL